MMKMKLVSILFLILLFANIVSGLTATGGIITTNGNYTIHIFIANGSLDVTGSGNIEVLIVAGGGGGGGDLGGGGGAGGLIYNSSLAVTTNSYSVGVGFGGLAGISTRYSSLAKGVNGQNSSFGSLQANGGGGGSGYSNGPGISGGSGGGGGSTTGDSCPGTESGGTAAPIGQGNNGGTGVCYSGGGGGGASTTGANAVAGTGGPGAIGGKGLNYSINGTLTNYSCGGGGGAYGGAIGKAGCAEAGDGNSGGANVNGSHASNFTGAGGGGGGQSSRGGNGGSGIVIIRYLSGSSSTPNPINISFVSQVPLNISSVSLFSSPGFVNITFNLSTLNRSNLKDGNYSELLYALTSNSQTCLQKVNETCVYTNNTGLLIDKSVNVTFPSQNFSLVSWFLGENILYPYVSMLFLNSFNISHTTVNLGSNDFFAIGITGLDTSPQFNIFEVMAISRLNNIVYICNGGFGFVGNPIGNQFCQEIGRLPNETNHTHNQFSAHSLIPFTVINGKIGGTGIQMQSRMYFILTGNGGPLLSNVSYINNFSNQESTRTSNNQGVTWNSQVYTADAHIHQYPVGGVNFSYLAIGNYSGNLQIAENQNFSLITVANLNPQPPIITFPVDVNISSQFINLSWSNASVSSLVANLSYYSVDLYLPDGNFSPIFNRSLAANVGLNNSFYFDVYNLNLSLGSWLLRVTVFDTLNRSSFDQERFNLSTNAYFNFTAQDNITKVNVQNWSYNVTDLNTSVSYSLTASGLNSIFNIVKGHIFLVTVDSAGYSITSFNLSSNNSIRQDFIMPLFLTNSVFITVLDEDIGTLINDTNITVSVTSSVYVTTIIITNGTYYLSNIPAGLYDFNFQAANYSTKDYFITITDRTTQALIARLGRGYSTIGTYVRDAGDNPITQALITVQRLINTSYITIGQQQVDGVGYARFSLKDGFEYLWTVDAAGYSPKQFFLRPYLANQPYKFKLALSTSSNFTTYNDFVSYAYLPKGTSLFPDVNNFSWTVISKNSTFGSNSILWFSQDCGSGLTNNSGSPSGGTILQTLNLTAFSGVLTCYYSFQVDGFSQQTLKVPYAVKNYPIIPGNLSVYQVAQDFKTDNNDEAWLGIIATFLAFVTALFLKEVSLGDGIAGTIAAAAVLTIFGFMGWLAWSMCLAIDIIVFILFSNDRSGY